MSAAFVQKNSSTAATVALTSVTAGNFLCVGAVANHSAAISLSSISDSAGDTWVKADAAAPFNGDVELWYDTHAGGATSGTHTLTITWSATPANGRCAVIAEYSGVTTGTSLDLHKAAVASSGNATLDLGATAGSAAASGELGVLFAGAAGGSSWPITGGTINSTAVTTRDTDTHNFAASAWLGDLTPLGSGTQDGAATVTTAFGGWALVLGVFTVTGGGAAASPPLPVVSWPQAMWRSAYR